MIRVIFALFLMCGVAQAQVWAPGVQYPPGCPLSGCAYIGPISMTNTLTNYGSRTGGTISTNTAVTNPTGEVAPMNFGVQINLTAANIYEVLNDFEMAVNTNTYDYTQEEHTTPGYFHVFGNNTTASGAGSIKWLSAVVGMADNEGTGTLTGAASFVSHSPGNLVTGGALTNHYVLWDDGCASPSQAANCYGISTPDGIYNGFGTPAPRANVHSRGAGTNGSDFVSAIFQNYLAGPSQGVQIQLQASDNFSMMSLSGRYDATAAGYAVIGAGGPVDVAKFTAPTGTGSGRLGVNLTGLPAYTLDVGGVVNSSTGFDVNGTAGLASKTCTISALGATITITGGIVTATTGC